MNHKTKEAPMAGTLHASEIGRQTHFSIAQPLAGDELSAWQNSFEYKLGCFVREKNYDRLIDNAIGRQRDERRSEILERIRTEVDDADISILGAAFGFVPKLFGYRGESQLDPGEFIVCLMATINGDEDHFKEIPL